MWASPAKGGGRAAPSPPAGSMRSGLDPSLLLLQQMEGAIDRIVEQVVGRLNIRGSMGSLIAPQTPVAEHLVSLDYLPALEAPIVGASDAGGPSEPTKKKKKKKKKKESTAPSMEYFDREVETV